MYKILDAQKLIDTISALCQRISERFPGSSLSGVCRELRQISEHAVVRTRRIQHASLPLRVGSLLLVLGIGALIANYTVRLDPGHFRDLPSLAAFVESAIGSVVFIGAAAIFLLTIDVRLKRHRALEALYELRVLAHIVDMHQLTKDPERVLGQGTRTASSPAGALTPYDLSRYLDYCTELLSMISKIGVLYVQRFHDPVVLEAVDQLEDLTTALSRKIWEKINILDRYLRAAEEGPPGRS